MSEDAVRGILEEWLPMHEIDNTLRDILHGGCKVFAILILEQMPAAITSSFRQFQRATTQARRRTPFFNRVFARDFRKFIQNRSRTFRPISVGNERCRFFQKLIAIKIAGSTHSPVYSCCGGMIRGFTQQPITFLSTQNTMILPLRSLR